ncbi:MAG: F-type H+-transporting ATPase subunit b [Frankiales bacterium]|jgi:F-type H+-transporting ATPase subunit b|nr:F-type H+-transporting ATPase subunit b [Frankiales bacterium]MDX6208547.1 F-type H+-transporting ATPase subunit b [Frankiales bacterium]MDX6213653.1 F-type H+-transporting ATPase subunit b [Frankiales bacterium]
MAMSSAAAGHPVVLAASQPSPFHLEMPELITGIIAFALLYGFLKWKVFPIFEAVFQQRAEAIEGGIAKAEQAQAEAALARQQYQAELAELRRDASRVREQAHADQARIIEEARVQARTEADRILEQARTTIEADRQQAALQLRAEIGRLAVDLAGRIVGESLEDEARQRRTVDRFLGELEGAPEQVS